MTAPAPGPTVRALGSKIGEATIAPSETFLYEATRTSILIVALHWRPCGVSLRCRFFVRMAFSIT